MLSSAPPIEPWASDIENRLIGAPAHLVIFQSCQSGVRLTKSVDSFTVTMSRSKPEFKAVSITRWKFALDQGDAAAAKLVDQLLLIQGEDYAVMRTRTMTTVLNICRLHTPIHIEPTSLHSLLKQIPEAAEAYLTLGFELIRQYMNIEGHLIQVGFDPGYRPTPTWMEEIWSVRQLGSSPSKRNSLPENTPC